MKPETPISDAGGKALLKLARKTIAERLNKKYGKEEAQDPAPNLDFPELKARRGTFVTLTIDKQLRGCIGNLSASEPIVNSIRQNALHAAFDDHRFKPLTQEEFSRVAVEVSILSDPQPLSFDDASDLLNKLRPGVDGVILRKDGKSATFLPQVWTQLPDKKAFLSHLCMKAGLPQNAWREKGMTVLIYQVQYFEEA